VYSDDGGETWGIGADVSSPGLSGENQLVQLDDAAGTLLTSVRENGAWDGAFKVNRTHIFARSTDEGESWEPAFAGMPNFPEVNCEGSMVSQTLPGGEQRLLYSGILGGGIGGVGREGRTGMVIRTSIDGGRSWPVTTLAWAGLADYSSLQVLLSGRMGLLYTRNSTLETVFQVLPGI